MMCISHKCQSFDIKQMHANDIEHIGIFIVLFSTIVNNILAITRNNFAHSIFSVNSAFLSLRQLIPTEPKTRKLSKIETLRLAKSYIEHLFAMLVTGMLDLINFLKGKFPFRKKYERNTVQMNENLTVLLYNIVLVLTTTIHIISVFR